MTSSPPAATPPAEPTSGRPRPAGTTWFIHATVSIVTALVMFGIGVGMSWLEESTHVSGVVLWAAIVTALSAVVGLVAGVVARLAGQATEVPDVRRAVVRALLVPAGALVVLGVAAVISASLAR